MRFVIWAVAWAALATVALAADEKALLRQAHAWGRFPQGAWRQVRIVTESFDGDGHLTDASTTDNTTKIEEISPERIALKVEVTVEFAGQQFPSQPQIIRQGYAGEGVGQSVSITPVRKESIVIGGRELACRTEQVEIIGGQSKEVSLISYSRQPAPRILKRRTTTSDLASGKTMHEAISEVTKLDETYTVLGEPKRAYRVRLVQKNDRGTTTTNSVHVPEIPGEVVHQSYEKMDSGGRLERRTTLELISYGVDQDDTHRDAGRRKRRAKRAR